MYLPAGPLASRPAAWLANRSAGRPVGQVVDRNWPFGQSVSWLVGSLVNPQYCQPVGQSAGARSVGRKTGRPANRTV